MTHILTNKEMNDILNDPHPATLLGFGGYIYANKVDIYTKHLLKKFTEIDKKYHLKKDRNKNKGLKGELLMCGIIDLAMWRFGFRLSKDYTVIRAKKGKKGVDFKLTCLDTVFLCEAKNWAETTWVNKRTYNNKIKTRFYEDGINILMIRKDKVNDVEQMYNKYSTDNGKPIFYVDIDNFMDVNKNNIDDINYNLLWGVMRLSNFVEDSIDIDRDFNIRECLDMGMPTWFISDYVDKSEKTVNRHSKKMGYNRLSSDYRKMVSYRSIR